MKKLLTLVLVVALTVTLFSGCGCSKNGGDALELTVWNTAGTDYIFQDLNEDIPSEWLAEKTGVKVANIYGNDGGQWDQKLTKLYAGDNLPDIVLCQNGQGPAHFSKLGEVGILNALTDEMIEKYAPNLWARTPSYIWDKFRTEDGKISGIPYSFEGKDIDTVYPDIDEDTKARILDKWSNGTHIITHLGVRDDILKMIYPDALSYDEAVALLNEKGERIGDELLDIPIYTKEEYIDFLYKIKDLNLKEDGKTVYPYGYIGGDTWEAFVYLGGAMFGMANHHYTSHWNTATKRIELPLAQDISREIARIQNKMVNDKVIDPESLIHTSDQFKEKVFNGQYAVCWTSSIDGNFEVINSQLKEAGKDFAYRPFYVQIPAAEGYGLGLGNNTSFNGAFAMTTNLSEDEVIKVLKWADLQFTDEFEEIYYWGTPEDGLYVENEDGTRSYKDEKFQKFFVEGDTSALEVKDSKGLGGRGGKFILTTLAYSKYDPKIYNNVSTYFPGHLSGFGFAADSPLVTEAERSPIPPSAAYSAEFGAIPEVVAYWGARGQWDTAIKTALAAKPGEFDKKWDEMLKILNSVVDVKAMEDAMTEVALPLYEKMVADEEARLASMEE